MRIVTPKAITDDNLISYNIPEADYFQFSPTTYYYEDDYCMYNHNIYKAVAGDVVASISEYSNDSQYIAGQHVRVTPETKIYKALLGVVPGDYPEWSPSLYYTAGQTCKITERKKVYKCLKGENPDNYSEWLSTTTYEAGDYVKITSTGIIYKSLKDTNLDKSPADNLTGISPYWSEVGIINLNTPPDLSVLYPEWSASTSYIIGDKVKVTETESVFTCLMANTNFIPQDNLLGVTPYWKQSGTFTENQNSDDDTASIWAYLGDINIGYTPSDNIEGDTPIWKESGTVNYGLIPSENTAGDDPAWALIGPTNAWRMFDGSISQSTSGIPSTPGALGTVIEFSLRTTTATNCVALFSLVASKVILTMTDPGGGIIWTDTDSLTKNISSSWSDFFFGDREYPQTNYFKVIPSYPGATLKVTITSPITAECGLCVVGKTKYIGATLQSVKNSITDYSKKSTSEMGVTSLSVGAYAKDISLSVDIENNQVDSIYEWVANVRATPLVFIADNSDDSAIQYQSLLVYGFYTDFSVTIPGPTHSTCTFEIQGLI